jgi:CheY-like chemotaxis protein
MSFHVLLCDDSETIQKVFRLSLGGFDVQIEEAVNLAQAESMLKSKSFDLVVCDCALAGTRALSDFQLLAKHLSKDRFLFLASKRDKYDMVKLRQYEFLFALQKPFSRQTLISYIQDHMQLPLKESIKDIKIPVKDQSSKEIEKRKEEQNEKEEKQENEAWILKIQEEVAKQMPKAVENYCEKHLAHIARAVLEENIQALQKR